MAEGGEGGSFSSSSSTSTGGLDAVSQLAEQYMQEQFAWGQQQFANNSQLTDQVVGDLMNMYSSLSGIGNSLMGMYQQYFTPEYQSLVTDANNYSSTARIQQAMGAAESGVAQNFNGQRDAALADLQSFGIDPSSGRYAQLDTAERTQQAAAAAGAGFQAEQSTEATGRALRSEALQLGSVMPSQATAAYNAAQGAATAGENATLANTQEGVNAINSATPFGNIAQQLKKSQSASNSVSMKPSKPSQQKQQGNQQSPQTPSPPPNYNGMPPNTAAEGPQGSLLGAPPSALIRQGNGTPETPPSIDNPWDPGATPPAQAFDPTQTNDPFGSQITQGGNNFNNGSTSMAPDTQLPSDFSNMDTNNPGFDPSSNPFDGAQPSFAPGDTINTGAPGQEQADLSVGQQQSGLPTYDDLFNASGGADVHLGELTQPGEGNGVGGGGGGAPGSDTSGGDGSDTNGNDDQNDPFTDSGQLPRGHDSGNDPGGDGSGSGTGSWDNGDDSDGSDFGGDFGGGGDDGGGGGSMAGGGKVRSRGHTSINSVATSLGGRRAPAQGAIPYTKSPSRGRVTDDVRAKLNDTGEDIRLNAGEFIMPRHTVKWLGEKYFQDLIRKSKAAREGAGAKATMKPPLPQRRGGIPTRRYHG